MQLKRSPLVSLLAAALGLGLAGLLAALHGVRPADAYRAILQAGFGCRQLGSCGLVTTLQFATPLLFSGLSAGVAMRAGLFNLGQAGQMLLGAAAAGWVGAHLHAPPWALAPLCLAGGAAAAAAWAGIAGALRAWLGVNEVIVTILLNQVAPLLVGVFGFARIAPEAQLPALAAGSKLNPGLLLGLIAAALMQLWFTRVGAGYAQRMQAEAPRFARFGGMPARRAMLGGMLLSGLRVGALNGLQLQLRIPRELGNGMIAVMMVVVSLEALHRWLLRRPAQPAPA